MPNISFPSTYLKFNDGTAADPLSEDGVQSDFSEWVPLSGNAATLFVHWNSSTTAGVLVVRWYPDKTFYADSAANLRKGAPLLVANYTNVLSDPSPPSSPRWAAYALPVAVGAYGGGIRVEIESTDCTAVRCQLKQAVV